MDQQITSVIVNRREHKLAVLPLLLLHLLPLLLARSRVHCACCVLCALQKGYGYHLDLFVIALLVLVCSVLGLPLFVAATVQSLNHVKSLQKMSTCNAPGETRLSTGVQYVSALVLYSVHSSKRVHRRTCRSRYWYDPF